MTIGAKLSMNGRRIFHANEAAGERTNCACAGRERKVFVSCLKEAPWLSESYSMSRGGGGGGGGVSLSPSWAWPWPLGWNE